MLSPYENLARKSQALMSVAARYYEIGRLAGSQAEKILVDGASPGDVARKLHLLPPIGLLQVAETVN